MEVFRREARHEREHQLLSPEATKSDETRGREVEETPDVYRTVFEQDRDRILHSKAFRRLKHKTQVFLNPEGDHFVTRLTHTMHVTQIGRSMSVSLGLNETLTEAICLAHDVGHSPFGHTGEEALSPFVEGEWLHSEQGVRVLTVLEPLNLTWEVLDGVRSHSWKTDPPPSTPEGMICRFADRIAYLSHDMEDAVRAAVISVSDVPTTIRSVLGDDVSSWIRTMIVSVVETSALEGHIAMDESTLETMEILREFMFEKVYLRPEATAQKSRAIKVIRDLTNWFRYHPEDVPDSYRVDDADDLTRAIDYVSGMTDRFALSTHDQLFRPTLPL